MMKILIFLVLGVSSTFATLASLGQFPYHADIFSSNDAYFKPCDGVLVRHNWVLTAAHCLYDKDTIEVQLGIIELWTTHTPAYREVVTTQHVHMHPNFDPYDRNFNDLALIFLPSATPSILDHPNIALIDLPHGPVDTDFIQGTLTGYSAGEPDYVYRLRFIQATIMTNSWCTLEHGERIDDTKICMDTSGHSGLPCIEANGGPLKASIAGRETVVGIGAIWTSWCQAGNHGVFTRVSSHLTWINSVIN